MVYKISDNAHIIIENGETILVADTLKYEDSITIGSVDSSLSPTYITDNLSFPSYKFQGSTSGYSSGGGNQIEKFPFALDAGSTDVGDLTASRRGVSGQSSETHGYTTGGYGPQTQGTYAFDKFPFASDTNSTSVASLAVEVAQQAGQSSETHGYMSGGMDDDGFSPPLVVGERIDKFPFASDDTPVLTGTLTVKRRSAAGISGPAYGYTAGGGNYLDASPFAAAPGGPIDRFPFGADGSATDVGDLTFARYDVSGHSSSYEGFVTGGQPQWQNTRDKFPFATLANSVDAGDLREQTRAHAGQSSTTHGTISGGWQDPPAGFTNEIDAFPFSTNAASFNIGDLTVSSVYDHSGQQV